MDMAQTRRSVLGGGAAALATSVLPMQPLAAKGRDALAKLDPRWLVTPSEALAWHRYRDNGPTYAGDPNWHKFMQFVEGKLKEYGCKDISKAPWTYKRLEISEWPDSSDWQLVSNGRSVKVSNYGANCGLTGPEGITAPLVLWDDQTKPDIAGRIVVYRPEPRPTFQARVVGADYEYLTPFESFPEPGKAVPQNMQMPDTIAGFVFDQLTATSQFIKTAVDGKAAGIVFAMNSNEDLTAGLYTFPVPERYEIPSLYLDRITGDAVVADARAGKSATLRVQGRYVDATTYQLIAYLPGRDYGTPEDQQILLRTHTDGPSISQDDGAFGLLGIVKYMSRIRRAKRPRTLFLEFDCRHFMPGAERTWHAQDYFEKFPHARDKVVGLIAMEHMGNIEYKQVGERLVPTGRTNVSSVYSTANQAMIDAAYRAAVENRLPAAAIRAPDREGTQGKSQGPWFGMGTQGRYLGLPAFSLMSDLGAYWQTAARLDRLDVRLFLRQVATFTQLTGFLMTADLTKLQAPKVTPPPRGLLG